MLSVNSARPPVGLDSRSMTFFSESSVIAAALPDHVQRHVARLQPLLDVGERHVAALVLAVGEDDERLASDLASQHVDAAQDHVVERGPSPRRQAIDRLDAIRRARGRRASAGTRCR